MFCVFATANAQPGFIDQQRNFPRVATAIKNMEDSLRNQFEKNKLVWPPSEMYIRSFKYDKELEVWVKDATSGSFILFKTYKVCIQSGSLGPKRMEGDFQVPEGFYYINEFNPNSMFHLSLGLNYPNASDKILSNPKQPGSNIFIHGNCVSTGCIPLMDVPMEELYVLAAQVRSQEMQEFIPVHIFPIRYSKKSSELFLENTIKDNEYLTKFNETLKSAYLYFNQLKKVPVILVNKNGEYLLNGYAGLNKN